MLRRLEMPDRKLIVDLDDTGGEGAAVLLVHGHPFDRTMWEPQLEVLSRRGFRVIAPDLRGYGRSTGASNKVLLDDFALDLASMMDALGLVRATLVGLSMGGQIAMEFCRRFPEQVDALALVATFPRADPPEQRALRLRIADRVMSAGMSDYAAELLPKMISGTTLATRDDVAAHVTRMMRSAPASGAAGALRGRAERIDHCATLARLDVPALVVVGKEDAYTTADDAACMSALLRRSELLLLPTVGHMPNLEAPDKFNKALCRLISRACEAGPRRSGGVGTALVTGASAGFGREIARRLAMGGWRVVAAGRRLEKIEALANEAPPGMIHPIALDVTDPGAVATALANLPAPFVEVDCLVNNAGLALGMEPAQAADLASWDRMIDTKCRGVVHVTRALLAGMVARGRGHVVNLGSVAGTYPYPGGNVYGATKAFVHQFSQNLRSDLHGTGVRVTLLEPGLCGDTEFSELRFGGDGVKAAAVYAGMKPLTASDIADTVLWAVSQPQHVNVNVIEMMPTAQSFGPFQVARTPQ